MRYDTSLYERITAWREREGDWTTPTEEALLEVAAEDWRSAAEEDQQPPPPSLGARGL